MQFDKVHLFFIPPQCSIVASWSQCRTARIIGSKLPNWLSRLEMGHGSRLPQRFCRNAYFVRLPGRCTAHIPQSLITFTYIHLRFVSVTGRQGLRLLQRIGGAMCLPGADTLRHAAMDARRQPHGCRIIRQWGDVEHARGLFDLCFYLKGNFAQKLARNC